MKINSKLIDFANGSITAKISADTIKERLNKIAEKTAKKVKIDGFRQGKVPINVVINRYKKELESDAKQEILKEVINNSLKDLDKQATDMIGEPSFLKYDEKDGNLDVEMEIYFKPKIDIKGYEEFIPKYSTPRVSKKEIDDKVSEFLNMIAPLKKSKKQTLEKGDFAKFDFEGFVNGVAFDGGSAKDYILEIGSNQFIPGFEEQMVGLKVGEEKDLNLVFPSDYNAPNLAGKDAVFKVKLNEIQVKNPAKELNEEILKQAMPNEKEPTKEKFEDRIKTQIREDKFQKLLNDELKPKFADIIVEKFEFDLPKGIVGQEIDMRFRGEWQNFSPDDMKKFREDKEALSNAREKYREEAVKSVKLTFLIDELARARNINVSDQELLQVIYFEAQRFGIDPKKHLETYQKQGMIPAVKMAIVEEKLFNDIFKKDEKSEEQEEKSYKKAK